MCVNHSLSAVVAHPNATPVAIANSSSISPTIVAARPSMRRRFTPSARSRKPALQANNAFCAFDKSIPDIKFTSGWRNLSTQCLAPPFFLLA